jgi:hypothetical protein
MAAVQHDAERFLSALAPDGVLTFLTFDDAKLGRKGLTRVLHGSYQRNAATLGELNAKGAGCFVMVNRGDCKGRKTTSVQAVRALFLDLDGSPLGPVLDAPIHPAIVCETSPDKFHAYWPIAGMPLADFRRAQQALAATYCGDTKVCDLPRVMRLPGYLHMKGEPFLSRLLHCDPVMPWNWPEFAQAMGLPYAETDTDTGHCGIGERNSYLYRFACGLRHKGLEHDEALRRVKAANARCCSPPLDTAEVEGIVASAWNGELKGFVMLPYSLIDGPAFKDLTDAGKLALIGLIRQHNGSNNGRISFTRAEARQWGLDKRRRKRALQDAEASGLIEFTEHGILGGAGHRASPDLFRLTFLPDRGQIDPYASDG